MKKECPNEGVQILGGDMQGGMGKLTVGIEESDAFIAALLAHKLIESLDISLRFDDGETLRLEGLYSIGLDALHDPDDAAVLDLFRLGHLQLAYTSSEERRVGEECVSQCRSRWAQYT